MNKKEAFVITVAATTIATVIATIVSILLINICPGIKYIYGAELKIEDVSIEKVTNEDVYLVEIVKM